MSALVKPVYIPPEILISKEKSLTERNSQKLLVLPLSTLLEGMVAKILLKK